MNVKPKFVVMSMFDKMKDFLSKNADETPKKVARGNCLIGYIHGREFKLFRDMDYDWAAIHNPDTKSWDVCYNVNQIKSLIKH